MVNIAHNSSVLIKCASALLWKRSRRGWPNVRLGIDVNSDQNLNPALPGKLCMKSWMLKPSVCRVEPTQD